MVSARVQQILVWCTMEWSGVVLLEVRCHDDTVMHCTMPAAVRTAARALATSLLDGRDVQDIRMDRSSAEELQLLMPKC